MASALEVFLMAGIVVAVAKWPIGQPAEKPKETNIGFFIYDILSGDHQTGVVVAGVNESKSNALKFGTVLVVDNPVTEGFERSSKEIGRAQGVYANSGHDGQSFYVGLSIVFTNQKYNGSTLQIQGTDLFALKLRELSIVGGTGVFKYAKGYAAMEMPFFDPSNLLAVSKFNLTLRHY